MNQWYFDIGMLLILLLLVIGMVICIIMLVIRKNKKKNRKAIIPSMIAGFILLVMTILYASSHSTYYKFNDWIILHSNVHLMEQEYGRFDLGEIKENQKGRAAYYIYTDNGPIMPDHLEHYYYIEYDEHGVIYNVYDGSKPGA